MAIKVNEIPLFVSSQLYGTQKLPSKRARFVTDNRKFKRGDIFIAIKGLKHDGHAFIDTKMRQSASLIIVNRSWWRRNSSAKGQFLVVDDTIHAMLEIGKKYLSNLSIPVVAVTGSNGKTTTKRMLEAVLSAKYKVHASRGNYNNRIGMPLSVFEVDKHDMTVLEMGTNHFGEISELSRHAMPETAVITGIGRSHLEYLKTRQGVLKAKLEILDGMRPDGYLFVNGDDDLLSKLTPKNGVKIIKVGFSRSNDIIGTNFSTSLLSGTSFVVDGAKINLPIPGKGAAIDALLSIAVAKHYGIKTKDAAQMLINFKAANDRMEVMRHKGLTIISDCYNANPDSVLNALSIFKNDYSNSGRKIAVLGAMGELGKKSGVFHYEVGRQAAKCDVDILITVGDESGAIKQGAMSSGIKNIHTVKDTNEAISILLPLLSKGDIILIKGSHSVGLEKIYPAIIEKENK